MPIGPLEYLVIEFPGNRFKGEVIPALREVVDKGTIRVIDLLFIRKDADGKVTEVELEDLDPIEGREFSSVAGEITGLFSEDDVNKVADALDTDSSAALLLFEHLWAADLRDAISNAGGILVADERISNDVVQRALAYPAGDRA